MGIWKNRPLAVLCGIFLLSIGILVNGYLADIDFRKPIFALMLLFLLLQGSISLTRGIKRRKQKFFCLLAASGLCLSLLSLQFDAHSAKRLVFSSLSNEPQSFTIEGTVTQWESYTEYLASATVKLDTLDGSPCDGSVRLSVTLSEEELPGISRLSLGDGITGEAVLEVASDEENGFALRRYLMAQEIFAVGELSSLSIEDQEQSLLQSLREWISLRLRRNLSEEAAGLTQALLLGNREGISDSHNRDFKTLGVSHLLAVSGLHLTVMTGAVGVLLERFRFRRRTRLLFQSLFCLGFMALCGFTGSVTRAGVLFLLALSAKLFHRKSDSLTALFLAGMLILLPSPLRFLDTGLQLSFLATLGILFLHTDRPKESCEKKGVSALLSKGFSTVSIGVAAVFFTYPVAISLSSGIALLSPIATPLLAPIITLLLYTAPLTVLTASVPFLGGFTAFLCEKLTALLYALTDLAQTFSDTFLVFPEGWQEGLSLAACLLILLCLLFPFQKTKKSHRILAGLSPSLGLLLLLLPCLIGHTSAEEAPMLLYCRGENQNEALLLKVDDKTFYLDLSSGASAMDLLSDSRLKHLESGNVDGLVLTHLHARHGALLKRMSERYYLQSVYLPMPQSDSDQTVFATLRDTAEALGLTVILYRRDGKRVSFNENMALAVTSVAIPRSTHPTLALLLEGGNGKAETHSLLYIGSAFPLASLPSESAEADGILFGTHGPIFKHEEGIGETGALPSEAPIYIFADSEEKELLCKAFPHRVSVFRSDTLRFLFADSPNSP